MAVRAIVLGSVLAALAAAHAAVAAVGSDAFAHLEYREIGPAISGGRSPAVAGSNRDPLLYFAGGAGGGVFKSTDGGASWIPVFDAQPAAPIGAIAIAPQDDRDVWVGTGESNPRNTVESGDGIYHTIDGGAHWRHAGLERSAHISRISIDPRDRRIVAVGVLGRISADDSNRGVYVTRDGGAHWNRTLYVGPSSGVSSLVRVPDRPSTLLAGVWQVRRLPWRLDSGGTLGGIYRSDDDGSTWHKLLGHGLPKAPTGRIGLAAAGRGRIYAIVESREGELWRSDDGGANWKRMPHSPLLGARAFYFSSIYVDPANRDRLINVSLILSMSTDGGRSFHPIATGAGWDYHDVWWSANGRRIINGNDEGVILSADGGAHFWQPYDLPFAQPYHVGFDRAIPYYRVCIGLQDDNTWCGPSTSDNDIGVLNRDWYQVGPGDGMWALFDPKDPNLVWSTATNSDTGQVYLFDGRTKQVDEVSPDAESNGELPARALRYRFNWETPIAFTNDGKILTGGNVVFESADRGQTWNIISPDLTRNDATKERETGGPIGNDESGAEIYDTLLYLATKLDDGIIWTSSDDGLVHLTRDGGAHWRDVSPPASLVPPWGRIACIDAGRFGAGTAFVAIERHLLGDDRPYIARTDDYGATWRSISGNLPGNQFVRAIRQDPRNADLLYAGTNRGVWVSLDGGAHWQSLRLNMPATAIYDLEIQPDANDLVVAAHGRGVWILDDLTALQSWSQASSSPVVLFAPRETYRMWQWAPLNTFTDPKIPPNEYVGENPEYGALLTYYFAREPKRATIEIADARGRLVRRLTGDDAPKDAGTNRTSWDLDEDGPVKWTGTYKENQGPDTGAEVLPGAYEVRIDADGVVKTQPLIVKADPRDPDLARARSRYDFLSALNAQLGTIDTMLNAVDARLKAASGTRAAALRAFKHRLTYDPRNIEDLTGPAQIREGVLDLISRLSGSLQAPTAAQLAQAASYTKELEELSAAYRNL
ncbi:MAG TPA: hypothetical protein VFE16_09980 [Candidatus Cybelea sp.]|jgi:photosystem II stability/assembly factor-like uncharacterized protein|nr:hypothetical protein [Candidatus Cybelea sp.]